MAPHARLRPASWRRLVALSGFGVGLFLLFFLLFRRFGAQGTGDFGEHIQIARIMGETGRIQSERFGFELLVLFASGLSLSREALGVGAAIVATLGMVAKGLLSATMIGREVGFRRSLLLSLIVLFLAPITLQWADHPLRSNSPVHLGQISGMILHNPTTILVFPFALLLFQYSWREQHVRTASVAALQCLVKPSFVIAWAPVYLALQIWRHGFDPHHVGRTLASLVPVTVVLVAQYLASDTLASGIVFAPFEAWNELSENILVSIVRSLAFPVVFAAVYWEDVRVRGDHLFAWSIFGVAFMQYALLYITGDVYAGNWSWGRYLSIYLVFLLCLVRFAALCARPESWRSGWRVAANLALGGLVGLHLYAGVRYFVEAFTRGRW